jgi:fatty-acyl-CoA synthase
MGAWAIERLIAYSRKELQMPIDDEGRPNGERRSPIDHAKLRSEIRTLADIPRVQRSARGEHVALAFEGRSTSYREFDLRTDRVANGLFALGLQKDQRVAYLGKNSDSYFELLFGAMKMGAVMTPVNWRLALLEIEYIVQDCGAAVLFVGPEFADLTKPLMEACPSLAHVFAMEAPSVWPEYVSWRDGQLTTGLDATPEPDDVAVQIYTSGTTGRPKGAMLTHRSILTPRMLDKEFQPVWDRWSEDDISLVAMPAFHIAGTGWGIVGLLNGATSIVAREFNPVDVLEFVDRDRITKMLMVPSALQIVVQHPRARDIDFSCMKYLLYGASPIPLELLKECMAVFGCGFVQLYGMTETSGTIIALPPEDHTPEGSRRMRSAGKPLPGVEILILDPDGNTLSADEVGEIAVRSPGNMAGYWRLEEATAQTIDASGWLRTGDAGYIDEDGYVYIHDRIKEMIISGGENIYPAEVENAIFGHPDVGEVAVIGVPDPKWGEAVKAMVVRRAGSNPSEADIISWARERIAGYKAPKSVEFIDALPRNGSGKILRRELRTPFWAGADRQVN